ncbi:hypothetical protein [Streptomyces sp. NPDC048623]|uniref:hypothetical protein n=1 Tax=Streptomyces sp. NPDC048623 TaxID=3155761 RepID=UPI00341D8C25
MTEHTVSPTNPLYVTGASHYRMPFTGFLTPDNPRFEVMQETFKPEHHRPDGYGLGFLESEEYSVLYVGSVQQIEEYRASGGVLDTSQGVMYAFWPRGEGWEDYVPANTWNTGGEGIVTTFDHPLGGRITVWEWLDTKDDGTTEPMVGFHCERCHRDSKFDHETHMTNTGPQSRRWMGRQARAHIHQHTTKCRPVDPRFAEAAQQAANAHYGGNNPTVTWESRCATKGPCAQIRQLRARA